MSLFRAHKILALILLSSVSSARAFAQFASEDIPASLSLSSPELFAQVRPLTFSSELFPITPAALPPPTFDFSAVPLTNIDTSNLSSQTFTLAKKTPLLLLPEDTCKSPEDFGLLPTCLLPPPSHFNAWDDKVDLYGSTAISPIIAKHPVEKFHWKPALWQSFGFLVAGHAFRFGMDGGARYLLFHKPFWHDYWVSADNFHMSRWGDGDDFLVNYIGHPMEGAVYGDIFLNNDPKGRAARFGKSSNYWYSRLKAMAWSTAWEAYFEIGPVFSEAAFGNEGGYYYWPGCGRHLCDKPHKPITNNTGWVDFVITPLVGTGWIVMEDAIEREFVDRLADGSPALGYKILRGSLAPAHTFANLFAGKKPWFRYPEEGSFQQTFGGPLHPAERPLWKDDPRYNFGIQYIAMEFPLDSESCQGCKEFYSGYGFDFNYRIAKYAWVNLAANLFPGSGSYGKHGGAQETFAGFKFGRSLGNWGIYSNLRNGFIHYDKALVPGSSTVYESVWRYALDLGGSIEYAASRRTVLRFNAGTTFIHVLQPYSDPKQPPVSLISDQYYTFAGSAYLTTGYVFRF